MFENVGGRVHLGFEYFMKILSGIRYIISRLISKYFHQELDVHFLFPVNPELQWSQKTYFPNVSRRTTGSSVWLFKLSIRTCWPHPGLISAWEWCNYIFLHTYLCSVARHHEAEDAAWLPVYFLCIVVSNKTNTTSLAIAQNKRNLTSDRHKTNATSLAIGTKQTQPH